MSILFNSGAHAYVGCSAGTIGAAGTGAYTIVSLLRPTPIAYTAAASLYSGSLTGTKERQIIADAGKWFGQADFTAGFGTATAGVWYLIGQGKAAGSNPYRWHGWAYAADGSGAKSHADTSPSNFPDGSTIAGIRIGDGDDYANGEIALVAIWKRNLSDADFDALCGNTAAAFMNLGTGAPDALLLCNVSNPANIVDATGNGANATTVSGTVTGSATDPPSFDYSLSSSSGISVPWIRM